MKNLLALLAGLVLMAGCTKAPSRARAFLYASNEDRADFISTFTTEPACNGLTLDTTLGDEPRLHYHGNVFKHSSIPVSPRYVGYIVMPDVPNSDIDFAGDTEQSAIRQACAILTHKGGTVR
jgi:hypothetical protein